MKNYIYILFSLCLGITYPVLSQSDNSADIFSLSIEELMGIKVTGSTLTPENLKTVPSAVTVFTKENLKQFGVVWKL